MVRCNSTVFPDGQPDDRAAGRLYETGSLCKLILGTVGELAAHDLVLTWVHNGLGVQSSLLPWALADHGVGSACVAVHQLPGTGAVHTLYSALTRLHLWHSIFIVPFIQIFRGGPKALPTNLFKLPSLQAFPPVVQRQRVLQQEPVPVPEQVFLLRAPKEPCHLWRVLQASARALMALPCSPS
jgi:hypothetical protein